MMKKVASILLVLVLCAAFATPVWAEDFAVDQTISSGNYEGIVIRSRVKIRIEGQVTINGGDLVIGSHSKLTIGENGCLKGEDMVINLSDAAEFEVEAGGAFDISFYKESGADAFAELLDKSGVIYFRSKTRIASEPLPPELCTEHQWQDGECTLCGEKCTHEWNNGKCAVCKFECTHDWNNGKCTLCEFECPHTWQDGECTVCGEKCTHEGAKCDTCGKELAETEENDTLIGSVLSEGSLTIIVGVAAFVLGLGVMFFIMRKKRAR